MRSLNINADDIITIDDLINNHLKDGKPLTMNRFILADEWLKKPGNDNLENVKKILPHMTNYARNLLGSYLLRIDNQDRRYDDFVNLIMSTFAQETSPNLARFIASSYKAMDLPKNRIPELCRNLCWGDENSQTQLFNAFLSRKTFGPADQTIISNFISSINDPNFIQSVLVTAKSSTTLALKKTDIAQLVKDQVPERYTYLKAKLLKDCLSEDGLAKVREEFHPQELPEDMNLAQLLAYHVLYKAEQGKNAVKTFHSLLNAKEGADFKKIATHQPPTTPPGAIATAAAALASASDVVTLSKAEVDRDYKPSSGVKRRRERDESGVADTKKIASQTLKTSTAPHEVKRG